MSVSRNVFLVLFVVSCISTSYLYTYPALKGCHFPAPDKPGTTQPSFPRKIYNAFTGDTRPQSEAPFRLLALGDPQLEGDTSIIHDVNDSYKPSKLRDNLAAAPLKTKANVLAKALYDLTASGIVIQFQAWRKRLDLLGNDYYLAHIYRTIHRYTNPTHVTVLGDLLGSQWIDDAEFERRASRYWTRVFRDGLRVDKSITSDATIEVLGEDKSWSRRIINIAGNHDIGYAGDLSPERLARFERAFGAAGWEIVFQVPLVSSLASAVGGNGRASEPSFLRLVILNSMNLDTPAKHPELQAQTYDFINEVIARSEPVENRSVGTIVLTHIPLYKDEGVCVDGPYFSFHDDGSGLKEQNHLSYSASKGILEGIFGFTGNPDAPRKGLGRKGLVVNGHDHEGCDVYHYLPPAQENEEWEARRWNATEWNQAADVFNATTQGRIPGLREVTLRSMMGEYGGWAYLISAWFETDRGEWVFEVGRCSAGVQHWWWAVHVLILATTASGLAALISEAMSRLGRHEKRGQQQKKQEKAQVQVQIPAQRPRKGTFGLGNTDDLSWDPPPESPVVKGTGAEIVGNGHVKKRRP